MATLSQMHAWGSAPVKGRRLNSDAALSDLRRLQHDKAYRA